jgi:predicted ATPase
MDSKVNLHLTVRLFRQAVKLRWRHGALLAGWLGRVPGLELRAIISLSRLWQKHDKKAEARQMLQEIYNWFTEGFNTADLKEAKELLMEDG